MWVTSVPPPRTLELEKLGKELPEELSNIVVDMAAMLLFLLLWWWCLSKSLVVKSARCQNPAKP